MTPTTPQEALESLRTHQTQLDQDGIMVGVSRQALEEVLEYCSSLEANQRTPGTFEVCELCGRAASLLNKIGCGKLYDVHGERECPIKQVKP